MFILMSRELCNGLGHIFFYIILLIEDESMSCNLSFDDCVHLIKHERFPLNPGAHQTSKPRPLKRWVSVRFQKNSAVRLKYERNTDHRHLNRPKTPKKDRMLKHTRFFSS